MSHSSLSLNHSKKADLTLTELIGLILAFFIIVFFFVPLGMKIYRYFQQDPNPDIMRSLERLQTEIGSLTETQPSKTVPFFLEQDFAIVAYNIQDATVPLQCKKQSCLCIVKKLKGTIHNCIPSESLFTSSGGLIVLDTSSTGVINVQIVKAHDKVSIRKI